MYYQTKAEKERVIENYLRFYNTYLVSIKNCQQQLDYITPSLVTTYGTDAGGSFFYIVNDTEKVAIDRLEGRRALNLREEIEKNTVIVNSINEAMKDLKNQEKDFVVYRYFECLSIQEVRQQLGYSDEKSVFRIRRMTLDKLLISLSNLLTF